MRFSSFIFAFLCVVHSTVGQLSESYTNLKFDYAEAMMKIEEPVEDLKSAYLKHLQQLAKEAQEAGDLKRSILIRSEIESFRTKPVSTTYERLRGAQRKYESKLKELEKARESRRIEMNQNYLRALQQLVTQETRNGNLEAAVRVQKEAERIEASLLAGPATPADVSVITDFVAHKNCEARKTEEGVVLTGKKNDGNFYNTRAKFSPPFVATVVAKTDSTNIRVKYAKGQIILNWEVNQDELRVRHPETGGQNGIKDEGRVPTDEWVELKWVILDTSMSVAVDGDVKFEAEGNFSQLNSQVGVGPAFGSTVTLQSLAIEKL